MACVIPAPGLSPGAGANRLLLRACTFRQIGQHRVTHLARGRGTAQVRGKGSGPGRRLDRAVQPPGLLLKLKVILCLSQR